MNITFDALSERFEKLFSTEEGKKVLAAISSACRQFGINEMIERGVVLGFSGGADSVMLLAYLNMMRKAVDFPILALHVNHMIRGNEADADERFCACMAKALDIPFEVRRIDVPKLAAERKNGLEECARNVRYGEFARAVGSDERLNTIAVAHNATDNLETVIFNLMRGSGTQGLAGISPVRDNIVRPLILVSKKDIVAALDAAGIPFVTDSTNSDTSYTRNYVRHEILPKLCRLNPNPEAAVAKSSLNLREDANFIDLKARELITNASVDGGVCSASISNAHKALASAVIRIMAKDKGADVEKVHVDKIYSLIRASDDFSVDVPGKLTFYVKRGVAFIGSTSMKNTLQKRIDSTVLKSGINIFDEYGFAILISDKKEEVFSSNVYKFSIQVAVSSAIINGNITVRSKEDGDSYRYGGMTRKLKKLFSDRSVPQHERSLVPIVCDGKGILWVPGFGVRDDENSSRGSERKWFTLYKKCEGEAK